MAISMYPLIMKNASVVACVILFVQTVYLKLSKWEGNKVMLDMMKGNEAIAEAALRAGVEVYAGYPITPSTEVMEYLSWRMPQLGKTFIQAESELASIYIVMGVAATGRRVFTASSGPGISLYQEGISYMAANNLPAVILNVVRWGNGLGALDGAQTDYLRDTRGGGNGDYRVIVLCPESIQEAVDMVSLAYELAEKYRIIVEIMTDSAIGQMMEPVKLPPFQESKKLDWGLDGKFAHPRTAFMGRNLYKESDECIQKLKEIMEKEQRWEDEGLEDAEYVFVSLGLPGRATKGVVREMRQNGEMIGFIRPITAWPFPQKAFERINTGVKGIISVETNGMGQMVEDVALMAKKTGLGHVPIYVLPYVYGIPKDDAIKADFEKIKAGLIKEAY